PSFSPSIDRHPTPPTLFPYTTLFRSTTPPNAAKARVNHSVAVMVDILRGKGRPHFIDSDGFMIEKFRTAIQLLYSGGATCRNSADRKSTRLNSSHVKISYAVFCLKKK